MYTISVPGGQNIVPDEITECRDCLQVLLMEYGSTRIDNLAQLFTLTSHAEFQFSHRNTPYGE